MYIQVSVTGEAAKGQQTWTHNTFILNMYMLDTLPHLSVGLLP